ncbi:MAG TPA: urate hydroxylase PuuD [Blastocatellia bacterium]|nr:urate hydroxylase PuuD [Blastocatellia bacterium]
MKSLDGPTKDKVTPQLMPRALWWFRWGAFVTVLAGLGIFGLYLRADQGTWMLLGRWAAIVLVTYVVIYGIQRVNWGPGKGWGLAAAVTVIVSVMAVVMLVWSSGGDPTDMSKGLFSQDAHSLSISIGGGLGTIMFLNVWGIIWPIQKRLIAWTIDKADKGTAPPSEAAALGRRAFLASRMNTWLSIPMLLFMAAGSHGYFFGR